MGQQLQTPVCKSLEECISKAPNNRPECKPYRVNIGERVYYVWVASSRDAINIVGQSIGITAHPVSRIAMVKQVRRTVQGAPAVAPKKATVPNKPLAAKKP